MIFERVDGRRYLIGIRRNGRYDVGADVPLRPAPGSAETDPHDLIHFVVEEQAELRLGIYGQVAAGADVGGFFRPAIADRSRARDAKRSARIGRAGRADVATSERLASLVEGGRIPTTAEDPVLTPELRDGINRRLAELLARWHETAPGGQLILTWPDTLAIKYGRLPE